MHCIISRELNKAEPTKGLWLVVDNLKVIYQCYSLELPWKDNKQNISCILTGGYKCTKEHSDEPEGRGNYFRIHDVPGRTGVLAHKGNYAAGVHVDTEGCILPGLYFKDINADGHIDIGGSTMAIEQLYALLPNEFMLYIV